MVSAYGVSWAHDMDLGHAIGFRSSPIGVSQQARHVRAAQAAAAQQHLLVGQATFAP